mgnify:CR=1 FL=1
MRRSGRCWSVPLPNSGRNDIQLEVMVLRDGPLSRMLQIGLDEVRAFFPRKVFADALVGEWPPGYGDNAEMLWELTFLI